MSFDHLEVLVEEPSMEVALRILLPKILEGKSFEIHAYQCKQELLSRLPERLRGYRRWIPDNWRIAVMVDRDNDDCHNLKTRPEKVALEADFPTRTTPRGRLWTIVNRIVIEELEAWYFGDWKAVQMAYPRVPGTIPSRANYRNPDRIEGGTWEAFERILRRAGYFKGGLRKIEAAKAIAQHIEPKRNKSRSFQVFLSAFKCQETLF